MEVGLALSDEAKFGCSAGGPHADLRGVDGAGHEVVERAGFVPADEQAVRRGDVLVGADGARRPGRVVDARFPGADAAAAEVDAVQVGEGDDAEDGVPIVAVAFDEGHVDCIAGTHADEGARAVEWIDEPHPRPGLALGVGGAAAFFAHDGDAQGGEAVGEDAVAGVVGIGDRGAVALVLHLELGVGQPRQLGCSRAHHAEGMVQRGLQVEGRFRKGGAGHGAKVNPGQGDENRTGCEHVGGAISFVPVRRGADRLRSYPPNLPGSCREGSETPHERWDPDTGFLRGHN